MLNAIILSVVKLSFTGFIVMRIVIMFNGIVLNVVAPNIWQTSKPKLARQALVLIDRVNGPHF